MNTLAILVSVAVWLTPSPVYARGLLVRYGPAWLVEEVAHNQGYDLSPYPDRCGVSLISPADLGKIVWIHQADGTWYGPCLSVDSAARRDYYHVVYENWEVAEVPNSISAMMGFTHGQTGEIYIGACPPSDPGESAWYQPKLRLSHAMGEPYIPTPRQEYPKEC